MTDLWQPIAKHLLFPLHAKWEGNSVPSHLERFEASQWLSADALETLRLDRLTMLLKHAYANCPFYTARFKACDFNPEDFRGFEDLLAIPPLTKQDILDHAPQMKARNLPDDQIVPDKTGGSTGQPLHFFMDRDRVYSRNAAALRHDRWTGWDIGYKAAYLWGHRQDQAHTASRLSDLRVRLLDRMCVLDTSSITRDKLESYRHELLAFKPHVYIAYANSVYLYARYLQESGKQVYHRPKAIITSAEMLDPERRSVIESVFGCDVFDRYGSRETGVIASECREHQGLHICAETQHLEFIRHGRAVAPGEQGKIVLTDLMNVGMPFIRYEIGDVGVPTAGSCECGRGLPLMEVAAGRVTDFLLTPDGRIVSGASLTIYLIANAPGVSQAQLIQEEHGRILLKIVKGPDFSDATTRFFAKQIPEFFGTDMKYDLEFVDRIPVTASGKHRFSICRLDPAEMF
jgi:phenylacetate-coenzyme A ligase PaaK-like adenylate-forming protein